MDHYSRAIFVLILLAVGGCTPSRLSDAEEDNLRGVSPTPRLDQATTQFAAEPDMTRTRPIRLNSATETPTPTERDTGWKEYTRISPEFSYRVEYPSNWSWVESENVTYFLPPEAASNQESISIIIINYQETPPLPVAYTYTTIRTVKSKDKDILVVEREPSSIIELYIAEIAVGDYTAEFRFSLDRKYDEVFDKMLVSFAFTD